MKPLYSDKEVQFRPMNPQPNWVFLNEREKPDEYEPGVFVWYAPHPAGEDGSDVDWQGEFHKAPYRPGEKCYLGETWQLAPIKTTDWYRDGTCIMPGTEDRPHTRSKWNSAHNVIYRADGEYTSLSGEKTAWRSPVTLPQWAARRFFTIVSCEPMRIGEVTEEDAKSAGAHATVWGVDDKDWSGLPGHPHQRISYKNGFSNIWEKHHPGTWPDLWVWRREIKEERNN